MSTKKRRRGAPRRDEPSAHARLVETATELFYQEGIRAIGIDTVVARSGVSKSSLYRTFASKDDLIAAFARAGKQTILAMVGRNCRTPRRRTVAADHLAARRHRRSRSQVRSFEAARSSILPPSFRIASTRVQPLPAPTSGKCANDCGRSRALSAHAIRTDWQINSHY